MSKLKHPLGEETPEEFVRIGRNGDYYFGGESPMYNGRPRRTRSKYPYSYDPYVLWGTEGKHDHAYYTDRMQQWDYKKFETLCRQHFDAYGFRAESSPAVIEAFLSDYLGRKVKLTCVMQHCNWASGYPLWTVHWQEIEAAPAGSNA